MREYGALLFDKAGFKLFEVCEKDGAGNIVVIGYAILGPDGEEIAFRADYEDALAEFDRLTEDDEPEPPSFGM